MKGTRRDFAVSALAFAAGCAQPAPAPEPNVVNDITQLNPMRVDRIVEPRSIWPKTPSSNASHTICA